MDIGHRNHINGSMNIVEAACSPAPATPTPFTPAESSKGTQTMTPITLHQLDQLATVFTATVAAEARHHTNGVGAPLDVRTDTGLRVWTPILGPSTVLLARVLLEQPHRRWHVADLAGQLGLATSYTQRCIQRLHRFGWLDAYTHNTDTIYDIVASSDIKPSHLDRLHPELAALYARHSGLISEHP